MKKLNFFGFTLLVSLLLMIIISCSSSPSTASPASAGSNSSGQTASLQPSGTSGSGQVVQIPAQASIPGSTTTGQAAQVPQRAAAEDARNQAIDFDVPDYFPSEWEAIEAQYNAALRESDAQRAAGMFTDVAGAYNDLFGKTIPLYAQAVEDDLMAVREELINTGLTAPFPEYLRKVDDIALTALAQYDAGDYTQARDTAASAKSEYQDLLLAANTYLTREDLINTGLTGFAPEYLQNADETALSAVDQYEAGDISQARDTAASAKSEYDDLLFAANTYLTREELINTGLTGFVPEQLQDADETALSAVDQYEAGDISQAREAAASARSEYDDLLLAARVYMIREEIEERGFAIYDYDNFGSTDELALAVISDYEAGNIEDARVKAEEVFLRYNTVLANGWTAYTADRRVFAALERELALAEKADIASREYFREADILFSQAETELTSENFQTAAITYIDSQVLFTVSRQITEEKRRRALVVMRIAEEKIEESNESAIEAERIIEGGSR
ncbi:MAG: hypothetical protein LBQ89_00885 [Treponema sp.]|jgi:hypothetical protein|nr:hypothetical protein [Treponema sp.]